MAGLTKTTPNPLCIFRLFGGVETLENRHDIFVGSSSWLPRTDPLREDRNICVPGDRADYVWTGLPSPCTSSSSRGHFQDSWLGILLLLVAPNSCIGMSKCAANKWRLRILSDVAHTLSGTSWHRSPSYSYTGATAVNVIFSIPASSSSTRITIPITPHQSGV